jgi:hypothetical protein
MLAGATPCGQANLAAIRAAGARQGIGRKMVARCDPVRQTGNQ